MAAKLATKSVGTRKKSAIPTAKKVYVNAMVRASRRHVERDTRRVDIANRVKRLRGMAVRAV